MRSKTAHLLVLLETSSLVRALLIVLLLLLPACVQKVWIRAHSPGRMYVCGFVDEAKADFEQALECIPMEMYLEAHSSQHACNP